LGWDVLGLEDMVEKDGEGFEEAVVFVGESREGWNGVVGRGGKAQRTDSSRVGGFAVGSQIMLHRCVLFGGIVAGEVSDDHFGFGTGGIDDEPWECLSIGVANCSPEVFGSKAV
jgi:hypothetical protein